MLEDFRKQSYEKFLSSKAESSQIFKNDSLFMDFETKEFVDGTRMDMPQVKNAVVVDVMQALEKFPEVKEVFQLEDDKFLNLINSVFNSGFAF